MALQTDMLKALADTQDCVTVAALAELTGTGRKEVARLCGKLLSKSLVERVRTGCYRATVAGRAAAAAGAPIRSGPQGKLNGQRRAARNTFRGRLWRSLRTLEKATIPDLLTVAATKVDAAAINHAQHYIKLLARAGYVREFASREAGTALQSNGYKRWLLIPYMNTGPDAPRFNQKAGTVRDPNTREVRTYKESSHGT